MKDCFYIDNHILVVAKNHNVSLKDFTESVKKELEKENLKASYLEPIFPICSEASGIVVFALSSKAKERLSKQIEQKLFSAKYLAVCVGKPKYKNNIFYVDETDESVEDVKAQYVHMNTKTGKLEYIPRLNEDAIQIFDQYTTLEENQGISLVMIDGGLSHADEIRFVMSDAGSPVFGDKIYAGDTLAKDTNLALSLVELKFVHPTLNKNLMFRYYLDADKKPWSYLDVKKYIRI